MGKINPNVKKLYMADIKNGRAVLGADRNIESALASTMYLTIPTLKDSYRFSNAKIEEFMNWVAYYIDSYWRKQPKSKEHYLTDERRGCPIGMCDKFEKKGRKRKVKLK